MALNLSLCRGPSPCRDSDPDTDVRLQGSPLQSSEVSFECWSGSEFGWESEEGEGE